MKFLLVFSLVLFSCTNNASKGHEELNGFVLVEAEDYVSQELDSLRQWYTLDVMDSALEVEGFMANHAKEAGTQTYLKLLPDTRRTHDDVLVAGENFSNVPGEMAILNYEVKFNTPGRYYVWVRAYSTGSEDNGIHVGIDGQWPGSGQRMQWCKGKNQWTWESKQRTQEVHCGEPQLIYLDVETIGVHTISFSMREDGFEFDAFVLSLQYKKPE